MDLFSGVSWVEAVIFADLGLPVKVSCGTVGEQSSDGRNWPASDDTENRSPVGFFQYGLDACLYTCGVCDDGRCWRDCLPFVPGADF